MYKNNNNNIHHCVLTENRDKYVVYLDEPTAGAENGIENNDMQKWV